MSTLHVTDDEIQQFILDNPVCEAKTITHINSCAECQAKIAAYRALFEGIRKQPVSSFDFNITGLVLGQLPKQTKTQRDNPLIYLVVFAAILLTVIPLYMFRQYVPNIFAGLAPLFIYLLVAAIVIILTGLILDMYRSYQKKMRALDLC